MADDGSRWSTSALQQPRANTSGSWTLVAGHASLQKGRPTSVDPPLEARPGAARTPPSAILPQALRPTFTSPSLRCSRVSERPVRTQVNSNQWVARPCCRAARYSFLRWHHFFAPPVVRTEISFIKSATTNRASSMSRPTATHVILRHAVKPSTVGPSHPGFPQSRCKGPQSPVGRTYSKRRRVPPGFSTRAISEELVLAAHSAGHRTRMMPRQHQTSGRGSRDWLRPSVVDQRSGWPVWLAVQLGLAWPG